MPIMEAMRIRGLSMASSLGGGEQTVRAPIVAGEPRSEAATQLPKNEEPRPKYLTQPFTHTTQPVD